MATTDSAPVVQNEIIPPVEAEAVSALTVPATETVSSTTDLTPDQASVANTTSEKIAKAETETIADQLAAAQSSALTAVPEIATADTPTTSSALSVETPKTTTNTTATTGSTETANALDALEATPKSAIQESADAIYNKQKERYIADNRILQQSGIDSVKQKLEQSGYNDAGSQNAILALYAAGQESSMSNGINDLMVKQLDTNFTIAQSEQQKVDLMEADARTANIGMFTSMTGEPEQQIEFAILQSALNPEDTFWSQFNDTDFQEFYRKSNTDEANALRIQLQSNGDAYINSNPSILYSDAAKNSSYNDWKSVALGNNEAIQLQAKAWADAYDLGTVNKYLNEAGYDSVNDISEITDYQVLNEAYSRSLYDKAITKNLSKDIVDNADKIFSDMGIDGVIDEKERGIINDYASSFAKVMVDNPASIFGVSGNMDDFDFMLTDWYGEEYTGNYTKSGSNTSAINGDTNAVVNSRLDSLWVAYMQNRDPEAKSYTRSEFFDLATAIDENDEPINDLSNYVFNNDKSTISDAQAQSVIKTGLTTGGFLDSAVADLTGGFTDLIETGTPTEIYSKLLDSSNLDVEKLMETEVGKLKIEELVSEGAIPEMQSLTNGYDYANMVVQDENGKYIVSPLFYYNGSLYRNPSNEMVDSKYSEFDRIAGPDGGSEEGESGVDHARNLNVDSTLQAIEALKDFTPEETEQILANYDGFDGFREDYWSKVGSKDSGINYGSIFG